MVPSSYCKLEFRAEAHTCTYTYEAVPRVAAVTKEPNSFERL